MIDIWTYLKTANKPIVLYGTGNGADKIYKRLLKENIKISGVFASSGFKKGKEFGGFTVTSYEELKEKFGQMIVLVCFGSHLENVIENILNIEKEQELYLPDVPVYGENIFDLAFAKEHKEELLKVYNSLADTLSKKVFENTVYFKLTGKSCYLTQAESGRDEVFSLLNLNKENYLDLGAFNGDTIEEFVKYDKNYKKITALEPDGRNFRKLKENTANLKNIHLVNGAVGEKEEVIAFSKNKGRGNSLGKSAVQIPSFSINGLEREAPFTFIKADIEGSELLAIKGGSQVIKKSPKMHIACYHRSEDIFTIPLEVLKINPSYKVYMRHHKALPAWDINYIFIK